MKLHIETNLTRFHMNMFFIYTKENIRSKISNFDPPEIAFARDDRFGSDPSPIRSEGKNPSRFRQKNNLNFTLFKEFDFESESDCVKKKLRLGF